MIVAAAGEAAVIIRRRIVELRSSSFSSTDTRSLSSSRFMSMTTTSRPSRRQQPQPPPQPQPRQRYNSTAAADAATTIATTTTTTALIGVCSTSILRRHFSSSSSSSGGQLADQCEVHILKSPFEHLDPTKFTSKPLPELVMENWKGYVEGMAGVDRDSSVTNFDSPLLGPEVAIIDGSTGQQRTYDDFYKSTVSIAGCLKQEFGVTEHTTVCLFAPNHVDYLPTTLAVGLCGAKITPVNPLYTTGELQLILDKSHSSVLIAHTDTLDVALEAARHSKYVKHVVVMTPTDDNDGCSCASPEVEGTTTLESLKSYNGKPLLTTQREKHSHGTDHHPYLLPYSSGTTGLPKGVALTHANLVANLLQCQVVEEPFFPTGEKLISPLPFFHIYGMTVSNLYTAWKGHPVITMSGRFDLQLFLDLIREHQPARAHLVPPIILGLAKHPMVDDYVEDFKAMKCIISAAAPLGLDIEQSTQSRIGVHIKQAWGMSELSPIATINSDDRTKPSSVGPLVSNTYGKIVDPETGKSLPAHTQGELCIKGPQVMLGYLDDPEKTAECLSSNGWLRTGDVAYYDDGGYIYITDRIKELIKVRGYQVAPAELEALLLTHPDVNDVAVIPIDDESSGQLPRAYIVLKDLGDEEDTSGDGKKKEDTADDIYQWVKERVAPYKRLDGGIVFTDTIPKSASGKILRRVLRDELELLVEEEEDS
mmetsp:Transcript_46541/g.113354  ORF Transcript_46541/g.113354 Transcript_46541/m.113354 type:complete len:706 (+) Transcript_46541:147-2264(+)